MVVGLGLWSQQVVNLRVYRGDRTPVADEAADGIFDVVLRPEDDTLVRDEVVLLQPAAEELHHAVLLEE
eukprot:12208757-Alexandrium_andersonii.AAC.1